MTHTQTVLEKKLTGNGAVSIKLRCCDETRTDSWHTIYPQVNHTLADFDAWLAERKADVQAQHDALILSQNFLANL